MVIGDIEPDTIVDGVPVLLIGSFDKLADTRKGTLNHESEKDIL